MGYHETITKGFGGDLKMCRIFIKGLSLTGTLAKVCKGI